MLKRKEMKETINKQVTFILDNKLQKYIFSKIWPFL